MKDLISKDSVFQFEHYDPSIRECRPLIDPLPFLTVKKPFQSQRLTSTLMNKRPVDAWDAVTPSGTTDCKATNPAGSPSFARRPISNGHFQRGDQFKPSIRICQPPGGFDRINW